MSTTKYKMNLKKAVVEQTDNCLVEIEVEAIAMIEARGPFGVEPADQPSSFGLVITRDDPASPSGYVTAHLVAFYSPKKKSMLVMDSETMGTDGRMETFEGGSALQAVTQLLWAVLHRTSMYFLPPMPLPGTPGSQVTLDEAIAARSGVPVEAVQAARSLRDGLGPGESMTISTNTPGVEPVTLHGQPEPESPRRPPARRRGPNREDNRE